MPGIFSIRELQKAFLTGTQKRWAKFLMPFTWNQVSQHSTVQDELDELARQLHPRDVRAISYHITPPFLSQVSVFSSVFHSGYPEELIKIYLDPEIFENDPIPDYVMEFGQVTTWKQAVSDQKISKNQSGFLNTFRSFGFIDGVAVPLFGPNGMNSYLSLNFDRAIESADEFTLSPLLDIAQFHHYRICAIRNREKKQASPLSSREHQVLYWISRGKSNGEVASIMGLSEATIDTYLRRIFAKLSVHDRVSAIIAHLSQSTFKI